MFKSLTLFLVNCAADTKMYRSKYRGNIFFLFEDRTSFFFSIRHFWHKVRGRDHWTKLCALNRRKIKKEQLHNVCFCCLKNWNHPSRVHLLRKNTQLIRDSQKHVFQTISSQRQSINTLQSHVLSFHPPSSCHLGSLTKRKYSKKTTQEVPGRGGGCQRIMLQSLNLDTLYVKASLS